MSTSSSFEIAVEGQQGEVFHALVDALALAGSLPCARSIDARESFSVRVRRENRAARCRLKLGSETIGEMPPGAEELVTERTAWLYNEFGESSLALEQEIAPGRGRYETVFELDLQVVPRPEIVRDYRVMIEDAARVHEGLAHDVISRAAHRRGLARRSISRLDPAGTLKHLERIAARLDAALRTIARQPCTTLDRSTAAARYRGGDRVDSCTIRSIARDTATRVTPAGQPLALGKVLLRRSSLSEDLAEHRHIAETIRNLAQRAIAVGRYCRHAAELLRAEEQQWGARREGETSVFAQRDLPRVEAFEDLEAEAQQVAGRLQGLVRTHRFLAQAGPPRTVFGPTPVFLGRPAYREVYQVLLDAVTPLGLLVDGGSIRLAYRNLATLYEYWCFLRTVGYLRDRFGASKSRGSFSVIDEIYRPELAPGQQFRFEAMENVVVVATYVPTFLPWKTAQARCKDFGATLTREPLRPDITIEVRRRGRVPVLMVLDAKSTEHFIPARFREMSDYSRQIVDFRTGYQPVRQVFLLHRDRQSHPLANVPGYLGGRQVPPDTLVLGAVPCIPEYVNSPSQGLHTVLDRFLRTYGGL
jgi:hypothetical protein